MSVESSIPRPLEVIYNELAMSLCFIYRAQVGCPLRLLQKQTVPAMKHLHCVYAKQCPCLREIG